MSGSKNPSHGQKVDLGKDAPIVQEGAGKVDPDSLAAESNKDGEFASNRNVDITSTTGSSKFGGIGSSNTSIPTQSHAHKTTSSSTESGGVSSGQGEAAPSYVNNQFVKDTSGPHGKNITEDLDMSGRPGKVNPELGSKDDPARLAEQDFSLKQNSTIGSGPRQTEIDNEQPYKVLGSDTSA